MLNDTLQDFEILTNLLNMIEKTAHGYSDILFKTENDFQYFYINYYGLNRFLADDIFDYREYRIKKNDVTLIKFLNKCHNDGIKVTFEETFMKAFSLDEIRFISQAIQNNKISLEEIFNKFQSNINTNIMRYVL